MRTRPTSVVAVVIAASFAFAACAQGTSQDPAEVAGDEGEDSPFDAEAQLSGELEIMGFGLGDDVATSRYEIAEEDLGEDVTINHIEGALDIQQFLTSVASGNPPDLIYANRGQIGAFASRGAILPLTQCIEGEGIQIEDYRENALNEVIFNDQVYAIPEFNSIQLIQANADLLEEHDLTLEDVNGSSWEAVSAANEELFETDGGGISVIGYDSKLPEFFPLWARSNGVDLISEDARTAQINDPAAVEALEWALSIYDAQGGFGNVKAYRDSADFFGSGNQFAVGSLGAMPMEQWYINVLNDVSPDAPMAFDAVYSRDGDPLAFATGSAWAIPADSDNPAAACRFARSMSEVDTWIAAAENRIELRAEEGGIFTGILTGNAAADAMIQDMITDVPEPWSAGVEAMYEANDYAFSYPASPADEQFKNAWENAVNRVLNGEQGVQDALDQAQEEAQAALDQGWEAWDDDDEG